MELLSYAVKLSSYLRQYHFYPDIYYKFFEPSVYFIESVWTLLAGKWGLNDEIYIKPTRGNDITCLEDVFHLGGR